MKKFLDWLRRRPPAESPQKADEDDPKRQRDLQRLAKLTKTANLPGLEQGPKKEDNKK